MPIDFNEAREIIEAAKKRGIIRSKDEPAPSPRQEPQPGPNVAIPDWLKDSIANPTPPSGFNPDVEQPRYSRDKYK
jgi:hypothetical protein